MSSFIYASHYDIFEDLIRPIQLHWLDSSGQEVIWGYKIFILKLFNYIFLGFVHG